MAAGDVTFFNSFVLAVGNKEHDLNSDDWRIGLVTNATVPAKTTAAPCWGAGGTTNFSTNQIATGTSYTGPIVMTSETWATSSNSQVWSAGKIGPIAQDAGGATNIAYGIIYNNTNANKECAAFVEISSTGAVSLVSGPLEIRWNSVDGTGEIGSFDN